MQRVGYEEQERSGVNNERFSLSDAFSDPANPVMQDVRFAVAHITAEGLTEAAEALRGRARVERNKTLLGLSVIAGMAGQTGLERLPLTLYNQGMWYAGPL
jgi:hypothetical protein